MGAGWIGGSLVLVGGSGVVRAADVAAGVAAGVAALAIVAGHGGAVSAVQAIAIAGSFIGG